MSLIKWEPFSNDLEQIFEAFPAVPFSKMSLDLSIDIYEQNGDLIAKMHLPDIDPKNVEVSIVNRVLHISGSREDEKEVKDEFYFRREIRSGSFSRSIRLPKNVEASSVEALYKDGVLKIRMPIIKELEENKIKIKVVEPKTAL